MIWVLSLLISLLVEMFVLCDGHYIYLNHSVVLPPQRWLPWQICMLTVNFFHSISPQHAFHFHIFKNIYLFLLERQISREGDTDLPSAGSLSQVASTTGSEPIRSQELGTSSRSFTVAGSQGLGPCLTAFPGHKQRVRWAVEQLKEELTPIWDLGTGNVGIESTGYHTMSLFICFNS